MMYPLLPAANAPLPRLLARRGGQPGRLWLLALLLTLLGAAACQKSPPATDAAAVAYYTCPMHPQIHDDEPGSCPICKMDLVAVAPAEKGGSATSETAAASKDTETAAHPAHAGGYTCPMHPQVQSEGPGSCPICKMDLVPRPAAPPTNATGATTSADLILTAQQVELANIQTLVVGGRTGVSTNGAEAPNSVPTAPGFAQTPPPAVLTGTVTIDARRTTSVSSRVAGRIDRLYVRQTGQVLRRGAPLFSVYSEELQSLQKEYLLARAQSREAGGAGSYARFAEATAQKLRLLGVTAGQLRALEKRGRPDALLTYFSPQTGTVQALDVVQGQYVAEGSPLLTLTDLGRVWVEAQAYPAELVRLSVGTAVRVQLPGTADTRPGRVVFLSPERTGSSPVTLARIEVANPDGRLQPGSPANVLLPSSAAPAQSAAAVSNSAPDQDQTPASQPVILVPQQSIIHDGALSYIWLQTGPRHFRRARIITRAATANAVPVTAGISPGDRVVTSGTYLLQSEFILRQGADTEMSGMVM